MAEANTDMVKITIRLPRGLVKQAKFHALALDYDLQDFVAQVLRERIEGQPLPASLALILKRGPLKGRRAKVKTFALGTKGGK